MIDYDKIPKYIKVLTMGIVVFAVLILIGVLLLIWGGGYYDPYIIKGILTSLILGIICRFIVNITLYDDYEVKDKYKLDKE